MARTRASAQIPTGEASPFNILEDPVNDQVSDAESDSTDSSEEAQDVPQSVIDDMARLEDSFRGIGKQYRLVDKIGEGTFSTVYKAEDLLYDRHRNDWDIESKNVSWVSPPLKTSSANPRKCRRRYVAIKKIYVTSSPLRIQNELELLHDLRACRAICPLITAFRYQDQVVAVLPYYRHQDFRDFYRCMRPSDMQPYFRSLFTALAAVHKQGILHRDVKPTNFLYDPDKQRGVLVDFGLAEREETDWGHCTCLDFDHRRRARIDTTAGPKHPPAAGYPKNDTRPSRRANRAGTRGFRAPEVLFKCTNQTTRIDIWSAGVILLTLLSRRFPFFHSIDDIDAMIEISSIFGRNRMQKCAELHGAVYECTIPSVGASGFTFEKLILWSTVQKKLTPAELLAIRLLEQCMELNPMHRISAKQALQHEFLREDTVLDEGESDEEIEMVDT